MKKAAFCFLKQVGGAVLGAVLKARSLAAVKNKTSLLKTRLVLLGLLPNKKLLLTAISSRMHALMAGTGHRKARFAAEDYARATVMYSAAKTAPSPGLFESLEYFVDEEDEYPDLTHCLFDLEEDDDDDDEEEEEEEEDAVGNACSAVDLLLSSREDGAEFNLEDEIDHVADLFIRKFRRQMRFGEARIS